MKLGAFVRGTLGPLERPAADLYRSYFIDLRRLAEQIRSVGAASRILEVGCGEGSLITHLRRSFPESSITGIDVTPRVGRLYQDDRRNVTFRHATVEQLAEECPGSFDLVVLADVLHHVPPTARRGLLAAIRAALAPGGLFVLKDWVRAANLAHLLCWISDRWITGDRVQFFEPGELRALIEDVFGRGSVVGEDFTRPHRNNVLLFVRNQALAAV
jgi:SAM-dependent methyltransferase